MPIIQIRHEAKMGYAGCSKKTMLTLPEEVAAMAREKTVITFRPLGSGTPDRIIKKFSAVKRLPILSARDIVFYGVEGDSPLAPLIFWDAAHHLPVGGTITILGEILQQTYLEQGYYSTAFDARRDKGSGAVVLTKHALLPSEKDAGLDRWTFGIPVGPDDATLLNVVVARILELDIPEKEILLCGRPGSNFVYWDKVRIVGEDITAPPVRICAKKNRLAQEARFENLCILHDRVFLPKGFGRAVRAFGDHYPLTAFQSLYFDDKFNLVPRRYSDFGAAPRLPAQTRRGIMRDNDVSQPSAFALAVLPLTDEIGFYSGHAMRHARTSYPTGSMYLVKRSVWLACPQNESLMWTEFEDIEQAGRADALGIPSRINPYAITQSLIGRPLLSTHGGVFYETKRGGTALYRSPLEAFPIPRKPLIKMRHSQALDNLAKFANKYIPPALHPRLSSSTTLNSKARMTTVVRTMFSVKVPFRRNALQGMLNDYEKLIMLDQLTYSWRQVACDQMLSDGNEAIHNLVSTSDQLLNHFSQRPKKAAFAFDLTDYLPKNGVLVRLGAFISATLLTRQHKRVIFMPGGIIGRYRKIMETTPFLSYAKKEST